MAAEAAAEDAHRNAERKIAARMIELREYEYLKAKYRRRGYLGRIYRRGIRLVSFLDWHHWASHVGEHIQRGRRCLDHPGDLPDHA